MTAASRILTFSGETHFVRTLAHHLLQEYTRADDPLALARVRILLPNRRGATTLRKALFAANNGNALLLPSIFSLSELRPEDWLHPIPQFCHVLSESERLAWVAELLYGLMQKGHFSSLSTENASLHVAIRYAESFLALRDDCVRARIPCEKLHALTPERYAEHWESTLTLFRAVNDALEQSLRESGRCEPLTRQHQLTDAIIASWQYSPPSYPIIAAGSTASTPATASLLAAIAKLPQGKVVLPDLDMELPESDWQALGTSHPQYHLRQWLQQVDVKRDAVTCVRVGDTARQHCIRTVMLPACASERLTTYTPPEGALNGVQLYACADDIAEAETVALIVREACEQGVHPIMVVCDDTPFITHLQAALDAHGVTADRAGGIPATEHPEYALMMLVAGVLFTPFCSVTLLALLRHASAFPQHRAETVAFAAWLDVKALRGWHRITRLQEVMARSKSHLSAEHPLHKILPLMLQVEHPLALFLSHHSQALQLCMGAEKTPLFPMAGFGEMVAHFSPQHRVSSEDYIEMLTHAHACESIPVVQEGLAAVTIEGALEARLHEAELVIIPQMNECHWPRAIAPEPWLNRAMREQVGLNFAERQVALAAHDLCGLLSAPHVIITRAHKHADAPMVASRFWERLQLVMQPATHTGVQARRLAQHKHYAQPPVQAPSPTPALTLRPRRFSATGMEDLLTNPFVFFVRHVCRLHERERLDAPFSNKDIGTLVHRTMEKAAAYYDREDNSDYIAHLTHAFEETLAAYVPAPQAQFYHKRLARMLHGIVQTETARQGSIYQCEAESKKEHVFAYQEAPLTLHAKIDRLEWRQDGSVHVVDYKTGKPPSFNAVNNGGRCQLVVAAMLMEALEGVPYAQMVLEYWELKGAEALEDVAQRVDKNDKNSLDWDANIERVLHTAYRVGYDADVAFTWQSTANDAGTFAAYLARVGEW